MAKVLTLTMVVRDEAVLLGMKKRGFGAGHWNGFGGKVEKGETVKAAAKRELVEEAGLVASELTLTGKLSFTFAAGSEPLTVWVYRVTGWEGEPVETEEMRPGWFHCDDIPYAEMWPDDVYWMPTLLAGKCFIGSFHFDTPAGKEQTATILEYTLRTVAAADIR